MLSAVLRKSRQLAADPVLRRWLLERALGHTPPEPAFTPHRPPYLGPGWTGLAAEPPRAAFAVLAEGEPAGPLEMRLAGFTLTLAPGDEAGLFERSWDDLETHLSLHRFAWVPLMEPGEDPRWVGRVWRAWKKRFGLPDSSWAWHPYTAAERAANLLTFAARHGLPEGAAEVLAAHAPFIAAGLEWFGGHHTSNHCANNGRGLYLLGLALGLPAATEAGATILREEGRRLFLASGVLREGSTHYHLLLARQWASVWLAARAHARPEAAEFEAVLEKALSVLPAFDLPGRFPLIGDVSPDCPPEHLFGLLPGRDAGQGWTGLLPEAEREALVAFRDRARHADAEALRADGWLRGDFGPWSGLWHAEPGGWSPMPGHGHQDIGAAEIHHDGLVLFADAGRGSYRLAGEADPWVSGGLHGGLGLDGRDPYPQNRPYYAPAFRKKVAGPAVLERRADGVWLAHGGFRRLGAPVAERTWRFSEDRLTVEDRVEGGGRHRIGRRFVTLLAAETADDSVILRAPGSRRFRLTAEDAAPLVEPVTLYSAYGVGRPGSLLVFSTPARLPWQGRITVEVL